MKGVLAMVLAVQTPSIYEWSFVAAVGAAREHRRGTDYWYLSGGWHRGRRHSIRRARARPAARCKPLSPRACSGTFPQLKAHLQANLSP